MNAKIIGILITILLSLTLFLVYEGLQYQKKILETQNETRELLINSTKYSVDKSFVSKIEKYIVNQNDLKELWWNTLINQSGLSLIFTAIILLITLTVGFITNKEFDKTLKVNTEKFQAHITEVINDFNLVIYLYRGNTSGKLSDTNDSLRTQYIKRINVFAKLKTLKKSNFIDLYSESIELIADEIIHSSRFNASPAVKVPEDVITLFNQIEKVEDKSNVISYIQKYLDDFETIHTGQTGNDICKLGLLNLIKILNTNKKCIFKI